MLISPLIVADLNQLFHSLEILEMTAVSQEDLSCPEQEIDPVRNIPEHCSGVGCSEQTGTAVPPRSLSNGPALAVRLKKANFVPVILAGSSQMQLWCPCRQRHRIFP